MPIKSYNIPPSGRILVSHFANSSVNKRPNGRIDTSAQGPLTYQHGRLINETVGRRPNGVLVYCDNAAEALSHDIPSDRKVVIQDRLYAEARARWDGKLRAGHADLGVTLGSWRQSWDMIAKRGAQATRSLDRVARRLEGMSDSQRSKMRRKMQRRDRQLRGQPRDNSYLETPANLVLEGEFGWLPLITDAAKAFKVMTKPTPDGWVTARTHTAYAESTSDLQSNPQQIVKWDGEFKISVCGCVRVDNPNIWLANQLGLLNLPGVAWDLVPWSFVVNMFSNCGQIANSFTSYYGLTVKDTSVTSTHRHLREEVQLPIGGVAGTSRVACSYKERTAGPLPRIPLYFRMPELTWETALIAVSLAIQQVTRITKLLR